MITVTNLFVDPEEYYFYYLNNGKWYDASHLTRVVDTRILEIIQPLPDLSICPTGSKLIVLELNSPVYYMFYQIIDNKLVELSPRPQNMTQINRVRVLEVPTGQSSIKGKLPRLNLEKVDYSIIEQLRNYASNIQEVTNEIFDSILSINFVNSILDGRTTSQYEITSNQRDYTLITDAPDSSFCLYSQTENDQLKSILDKSYEDALDEEERLFQEVLRKSVEEAQMLAEQAEIQTNFLLNLTTN